MIKLDKQALSEGVKASVKDSVQLDPSDIGLTPEDMVESLRPLEGVIQNQLAGGVVKTDVEAKISTVVSDATISKLDQIEEQQSIFVKEQNSVFEKITSGIGELTEKIVAKIEENRVIKLETVAKIDGVELGRKLQNIEIGEKVFVTQNIDEIGE